MTRTLHVLSALAVFAVCWVCGESKAEAQAPTDDATRAAARQLGEQGVEAYWAHDYVAANTHLDKAYRLFATPTLALWSARARASLGQLVEAAERYREALRLSDAVGDSIAQKQAQHEAATELAEIQPRIPALTIELDVPVSQISLSLDGVAISGELVGVGRPTNPGGHRIVVVLGTERREMRVQLAERDRKLVQFKLSDLVALAPAAPSASAPQPLAAAPVRSATRAGASATLVPVAITALALGGVGLATGGITALAANGKCSGGDCKNVSDKSSYDTLRTVSTVSIWTGAALGIAGITTWLLAPSHSEEQAALRWDVAPTGITVRGAF